MRQRQVQVTKSKRIQLPHGAGQIVRTADGLVLRNGKPTEPAESQEDKS